LFLFPSREKEKEKYHQGKRTEEHNLSKAKERRIINGIDIVRKIQSGFVLYPMVEVLCVVKFEYH
jgi:hypothetical protein